MKKMRSETKISAATRATRIQEHLVVSFYLEGKGNADYHQAEAESNLQELAALMGFTLVPVTE